MSPTDKLPLYFSALLSLLLVTAGFIGLVNINLGILALTSTLLFSVISSLIGGVLGIVVSVHFIKQSG